LIRSCGLNLSVLLMQFICTFWATFNFLFQSEAGLDLSGVTECNTVADNSSIGPQSDKLCGQFGNRQLRAGGSPESSTQVEHEF
jgi:hypothetical protein